MQIARTWRQQASNLRLSGTQCASCHAHFFPGRIRCPHCASTDMQPHAFSGQGEVLVTTVVHEAPRNFEEQVPYLAGLVRLAEGPVIAALLTDVDPKDVAPGMPVEMVTRRIKSDGTSGPIVYACEFATLLSELQDTP